jgi:hypothetical protein
LQTRSLSEPQYIVTVAWSQKKFNFRINYHHYGVTFTIRRRVVVLVDGLVGVNPILLCRASTQIFAARFE